MLGLCPGIDSSYAPRSTSSRSSVIFRYGIRAKATSSPPRVPIFFSGLTLRRPPAISEKEIPDLLKLMRNERDSTTNSNVQFPLRNLLPLDALPTGRQSFDLWIAASTFARLGRPPTLTCARRAALPIDVTQLCCAYRCASRTEPVTG
jgi:hypothetical protein